MSVLCCSAQISIHIASQRIEGNFSAKQVAVQEKTTRSERPNQQLLLTEVQAKSALHSPGVHWELGIANQLQCTWRTCHSSNIRGCVFLCAPVGV